jgi:hypothetical protein
MLRVESHKSYKGTSIKAYLLLQGHACYNKIKHQRMTGNLLHFFQNPPILPETISESLKIAIESECPEVLSILLQYMYKVCCFENAENIKGRIKEILHGGEFILKKQC